MSHKLLYFLLSFLFSASLFSKERPLPIDYPHEFHLSKCQIDFNQEEQALQISFHMFIDDLEEALRNQGADKLYIGTEKESKHAEQHLFKYLQKCFKLSVNGKALDYIFIGKEPSEDLQAIWCYLEITGIEKVESILVENTVITEIYDDQKNIVHIKMPNKKQGYLILEKGKSSDKVSF